MAVQLNHTIVAARDQRRSAQFIAEILGLPAPRRSAPSSSSRSTTASRSTSSTTDGDDRPQHYAFLVGEEEFDEIFGRIRERGLDYWADPSQHEPGEINHHDGGRGVYSTTPTATASRSSPARTAADGRGMRPWRRGEFSRPVVSSR